MESTILPQTPTPVPITPQPITPPPSKPKNNLLAFVVILLLLALGAAGFLVYQNQQLKQQVAQVQPTPTPLITPTTTPDPTANWKIYTNPTNTYSFRYPDGLKSDTGAAGVGFESIRFTLIGPTQAASERTQTELSDGYSYSVTKLGFTSQLDPKTEIEKAMKNSKENCSSVGAITNTVVAGKVAFQYSASCLGDYTTIYVSDGKNSYSITQLYTSSSYKAITDQILSTFKFKNQNQTVTTNDWKTYTNRILKYTIKYPSDWTINTSKAELPINSENSQELTIYKGLYKLTILWPSAYGPGICLFDDQSRSGAPEMASYCEGKYIEFSSNEGKELHRRLVKPESFGDHQQWEVYTKEKSYFVTVPVIRFTAPLNFIADQVETMDQILSTYTSTN